MNSSPISEETLVKIIDGLASLRQGQTDINRRLNSIEAQMRENLALAQKLAAVEDRLEGLAEEPAWKGHALQAAVWVLTISLLAAAGNYMGVTLAW